MLVKQATKYILISFSIALVVLAVSFSFSRAEQTGTSGESGVTSYLKTTYNSVVALSYGSDSAGSWGDWGAYWNRIRSAAEWVPSSAATAADVRSGKTFYSNSRSQQTGTYPAVSSCSTQAYASSSASASKANNCGLDWAVASPAVTGDDKQDPRTGLVWSQVLRNNAGTIEFSAVTTSGFSWDSSGGNNTGRTAAQLCSDRGSGWRLPTQKEFMQGYVDGGYWALTNVAAATWTITESTSSANGVYSRFDTATTTASAKTTATYYVRCVR